MEHDEARHEYNDCFCVADSSQSPGMKRVKPVVAIVVLRSVVCARVTKNTKRSTKDTTICCVADSSVSVVITGAKPFVAIVVLRFVVASGHDERKGCHKERNYFLRCRFLAVNRNERSETLRALCLHQVTAL